MRPHPTKEQAHSPGGPPIRPRRLTRWAMHATGAARTDDTTTQDHVGRCVGHQSSSYAAAATVRSMQRSNDRKVKMDCFGPGRGPWKAGGDVRSGSSGAFILPADSGSPLAEINVT